MKTAIDTIREALDAAIPVSNIAYNLGQSHESRESNLKCVAKFDELRRAAITSLKSLEGQEVVAWMSDSGKVVSADGKLHMEEAEHPVGIHYDIPLVRLTKSANP